jgi:hypothetical protein
MGQSAYSEIPDLTVNLRTFLRVSVAGAVDKIPPLFIADQSCAVALFCEAKRN